MPQSIFSGIPAWVRVCNICQSVIEKASVFLSGKAEAERFPGEGTAVSTKRGSKNRYLQPSYLHDPSGGRKPGCLCRRVLCFTHFEGNFDSVLYDFFVAHYKIIPAFYKGLTIHDQYPLNAIPAGAWRLLQDFTAPFYIFLTASCVHTHIHFREHFSDAECLLRTEARTAAGGRITRAFTCETTINNQGLNTLTVNSGQRIYTARFQPLKNPDS